MHLTFLYVCNYQLANKLLLFPLNFSAASARGTNCKLLQMFINCLKIIDNYGAVSTIDGFLART